MAFAIIQAAGKQFKVLEGEVLRLPRISAEVGASVEFELLLKGDGEIVEFGSPASSRVTVTVLEHGRGTKLIVFKKKRRKQYKRKKGHRQEFTAVRVDSIGPESRDD